MFSRFDSFVLQIEDTTEYLNHLTPRYYLYSWRKQPFHQNLISFTSYRCLDKIMYLFDKFLSAAITQLTGPPLYQQICDPTVICTALIKSD